MKDRNYDNVNHPQHYISPNGFEVIDVIEAFTSGLGGIEATDTGNIIKYILRWDKKGKPVEDLEKAQWYLNHLIDRVKRKEEEKMATITINVKEAPKPTPTIDDMMQMDDKEFEQAMNEMELDDLKAIHEEVSNERG